MTSGTNKILFTPKGKFAAGRTVIYERIVVKMLPHKAEAHNTLLTVGGNLIEFPGEVNTPTAYLTIAKLVFNSVL